MARPEEQKTKQPLVASNVYSLMLKAEGSKLKIKHNNPAQVTEADLMSVYAYIATWLARKSPSDQKVQMPLESYTVLSKENAAVLEQVLKQLDMPTRKKPSNAQLFKNLQKSLSANYVLLSFLLKEIESNLGVSSTATEVPAAIQYLRKQKETLEGWIGNAADLETSVKQYHPHREASLENFIEKNLVFFKLAVQLDLVVFLASTFLSPFIGLGLSLFLPIWASVLIVSAPFILASTAVVTLGGTLAVVAGALKLFFSDSDSIGKQIRDVSTRFTSSLSEADTLSSSMPLSSGDAEEPSFILSSVVTLAGTFFLGSKKQAKDVIEDVKASKQMERVSSILGVK